MNKFAVIANDVIRAIHEHHDHTGAQLNAKEWSVFQKKAVVQKIPEGTVVGIWIKGERTE